MTDPSPTIALEQSIAAYLAHQRALGRGYDKEALKSLAEDWAAKQRMASSTRASLS